MNTCPFYQNCRTHLKSLKRDPETSRIYCNSGFFGCSRYKLAIELNAQVVPVSIFSVRKSASDEVLNTESINMRCRNLFLSSPNLSTEYYQNK